MSQLYIYKCELDIGLTHAMGTGSRKRLAIDCFIRAHFAALRANRPDLADRANELLGIVVFS